MNRWHNLASFCLFLLLMFTTQTVISQCDNVPRNVRLVRKGAGTSDDKLIARWNPPSDGYNGFYWYRTRRRSSGSSNWGSWSDYADTTATSIKIANPANIPEDEPVDFQIQVDIEIGCPVTASALGVSRKSPEPRRKKQTITVEDKPPVFTCETLSNSKSGIVVSSTFGLHSGIQCQKIGAAGIGIASVIEVGFVDAVDVWGNVQQAQVCLLHKRGSFIFLDAATSPRTVTALDAYLSMGMICTNIDRPGTVVLLPSAEPVEEIVQTEIVQTEIVEPEAPQAEVSRAEVSQIESQPLSGCWIWTKYVLRLRSEPVDGEILALVPYDVGLNPFAYSDGWYPVEWYGARGWLSGDLVRTAGHCG